MNSYFYIDNGKCVSCYSNPYYGIGCKTCTDTNCSTCLNNAYNLTKGKCIFKCIDNSYYYAIDKCARCYSNSNYGI